MYLYPLLYYYKPSPNADISWEVVPLSVYIMNLDGVLDPTVYIIVFASCSKYLLIWDNVDTFTLYIYASCDYFGCYK